ncbi:MAG: thioredoxin-dependent thiol peroxidase [Alphaproteobacteria bacterium]|nr:MAG: thioredoxin-dependent thiol peroxidase [Alphaproteobacteria bacterium]
MSFPKIGNLAPTFILQNQNGEEVELKSLRGKNIVLYFYPKAMTPGCTTQACGIRDSKKEFAKLNTIVLGLSPDEPKKLLKFIEKEKLNFDLLSDPDHAVCEKYGVWGLKKFMGREYMGVKRITFIIDSAGKLNYVMDDVKTKTHHDDVIAYIKENLV